MNAKVRIHLFGKLEIQCGKSYLANFNSHKAQELLCYLILYRNRPHNREEMADILWGEQSSVQAKKYLRHSLWQIQSAFGANEQSSEQLILLVEPEWVSVNANTSLWLDVAEFEEAFLSLKLNQGKELNDQLAYQLQQAVLLYQGNLLEGWYHDWCIHERERFQSMYITMLDKLLDYCATHQEYEQAISYGMQILRYDRARERTHQSLMRLHFLAGDRTAALRQYESCVSALAEELDVGPSKCTIGLWEAIRSGQFGDALPISTSFALASQRALPTHLNALQYLHELHHSLAEMLMQLEEYLHNQEQTVDKQR